MTALQADLLRRIQDFRFDPPASTYTFADRLAKENAWTRSFADRAIAEYRRFAYLAIAAGHPVSPSEVVDQVWHLHLIFTRSYWDDFCANTLGRPLHHEPSTGGYAERAKFADWSANTLTSYRVHFGAEPPSDIWLAPVARGSAHEEFRRVDVSRHWIVPKLRLGGAIAASLLAILLLLLAAGCSNGRRTSPPPKEWAHTYNPLDFTGPQFLTFYVAAFVAACCLAWRVRRSAAAPSDRLPRQVKLDAYAIAYLNGGPELALDAAVAKLVDEGAITLDAATQRIAAMTNDTPQQPLHLLEQAVLSATRASSTRRIIEVRQSAKAALDRVAGPLIDLELIPDPSRANTARVLATMLALSVPAVGALKVIVGLSRNRPVEFLLIACLVSVLVSCLAFGRRITRTRRGDQFLAELRSAHNAIRRRPVALEGDNLALGVGLFGISLLYGTVHAPLARALHPPKVRPADGSFGGGCGSHGSSCGGGGCGGGGCGGGGCGGCGGGS